jgi:hypothetical protein
MRKIILVISIICLFAVLSFGQTIQLKWQYFASVDEEFSVETPTNLRVIQNSDDKTKLLTSAIYTSYSEGFYIYINSSNEKLNLNTVNDLIRKNNGIEEATKFDKAKSYVFTDDEDFQHQVLILNGRQRKYLFHLFYLAQTKPNAERFFNSLKFSEKVNSETKKILIEDKQTATNIMEQNSIAKTQTMNGQANAVSSLSITPDKKTRELRITSSPKPGYSDLARSYSITGTVRLRVTFLADGKIGNITPITRLPMGLTNQAINAAKGITFEPKIFDGIPQTVTKVIAYSFTIY